MTQSTPLVVGRVVDVAGRPVAGARVRVFEGYQVKLDGVTQSTPLEGTTQTTPLEGTTRTTPLEGTTRTTPLEGTTRTTPLEGTTQTTPFDGVTQTTPLQVVGESGPDGAFAIRVPERRVLSVEASGANGDKAAILNLAFDRQASRVDVGRLTLDRPGDISGKVVGPAGLDPAGTAVFVPGSDLVARAGRSGTYEIRGVPAGLAAVAAVRPKYRPALARGLKVDPGGSVTAPDLLLVAEQPRLDSVEPDNAAPGATVMLRGADFGATTRSPLEVRFGRLPASDVVRASDGEIRAVVPRGAVSGLVQILVDGASSNQRAFVAIASISVTPDRVRADVSELATFSVRVLDSSGAEIARPSLTWTMEPADLGVMDPQARRFRASRSGFGRIVVGSGAVSTQANLGFGDWRYQVVAGSGTPQAGPLEGPANQVRLQRPGAIGVLPDGLVLFSDGEPGEDRNGAVIRSIDRQGVVRILAGSGEPGYDGDGLTLGQSRLTRGGPLAVSPDGRVIFTDHLRVRGVVPAEAAMLGRLLAPGKLWDLAGNGEAGPGGLGRDGPDSGLARSVPLGAPGALAWDPRGRLVFTEAGGSMTSPRIRQVDAAGNLSTLARPNGAYFPETTDLQVEPDRFGAMPSALLVDPAGNVVIGTGARVWLLCRKAGRYYGVDALAGSLYAIAGTGRPGFNGEEGPARGVMLWNVAGLALSGERLLVVDRDNNRLRALETDGTLRTLAGAGPIADGEVTPLRERPGLAERGDRALDLVLDQPAAVAVAPDGSVYLADRRNHRILRLAGEAGD